MSSFKFTLLFIALILLFVGSGVAGIVLVNHRQHDKELASGQADVPSGSLSELSGPNGQKLSVNVPLQVNGNIVLTPAAQPSTASAGQLLFDKNTNTLKYYDGTQFVEIKATTTQNIITGTATGGVTSLQGQTGAVTLLGGQGVVINGTTISNNGILDIVSAPNGIGVSKAGGVATLSLPQALHVGASPTFAGLTVNGGVGVTGNVTLGTASTLFGNLIQQTAPGQGVTINAGSDAITFTTGGRNFIFPTSGPGSQTICTTGVTCVAGGGQSVILAPGSAQSNNSNTDASIFINNTGSANLLQLQGGGLDKFVVASNGDTTVGGVLTANTITPTSTFTVGAFGQQFALQGSNTSTISARNGANTTTLSFVSPTANTTLQLPALAAGTYQICTTSGNCLGGGGGATTSLNNLASVAINTSLLPGSATIDLGSGAAPFRDLYLGGTTTNNFKVTGTATAARTITLPDASGIVAVSASGNIALSGAGNITFTGQLPIANGGTNGTATPTNGGVAYGTGSAYGFSSAGSSGQILQSNGAAAPGFVDIASLLTAGTNLSLSGTTNATLGTVNNPTFSASVTTPLLQSAAAMAITPGGALTIGATGQQLTLQGNATTVLTATNSGSTSTVGFVTPTGNRTINFPDASGTVCLTSGNCLGGSGGANTALSNLASVAINTSLLPGTTTIDLGATATPFRDLYIGGSVTNNFKFTGTATASRTITVPDATGTICLSTGNCVGGSGGAPNNAAYITVSNDGTLSAERALAAGTNISVVDGGANSNLTVATVNNPTFSTSVTTPSLTSAGALAITPGGALTVGATGQQFTLQGNASSTITATNGANTTTLVFAAVAANRTITIPNETGTLCTTAASAACLSAYSGGGSGVTSIGTIDSQTKSANGAVISGSSLVLQSADATHPGLVNTGSQTFAGDKSFTGNLTVDTNTLFVDSTNNKVGIGTTTLTNEGKLTVSGTAADTATGSLVGISATLDSTTNNLAGMFLQAVAAPSSASTGSFQGFTAQITSSSTNLSGAGASLNGLNAAAVNTGAGNIWAANAAVYQVGNLGGGQIGGANGIVVNDAVNNGIIAFNVGVQLQNQTGGQENTNLLIGALNVGGNHSIYNASTYDNIFAGDLRVGSTSVPTVALDVTGDGIFSSTLEVQGASVSVGGASQLGSLVLNDGSGGQTATIQSANQAGNRTFTIPISAGNDTFCLVTLANCGGGGSGVTTVGTIDTQTASGNGAVISGSSVYLQSASVTNPGLVNNASQSFSGAKTFTGDVGLGDATSDTILFTGRVGSDIVPTTDNTYTLGSASLRWKDLYLGPGSLHIGTNGDEGTLSYNTTDNTFQFSNNLAVTANSYINFAGVNGAAGYGIRDNNGVMEFKDFGGAWTSFSSLAGGGNTGAGSGGGGGSLSPIPKIESYTILGENTVSSADMIVPAGTVDGDLLVAIVGSNDCCKIPNNVGPAAGWTQRALSWTSDNIVNSGEATVMFTHVASGDAPGSTVSFPYNGSAVYTFGIMLRISGANPIAPVSVSATHKNSDDNIYTIPALTTFDANSLGISVGTTWDNPLTNVPTTNWSQLTGIDSNFTMVYQRDMASATTYAAVPTGYTGDKSFHNLVFAINPASQTGFYAGTADLQDDFNDNSIDVAKWNVSTDAGTSATETGNQMVLGLPTAGNRYVKLESDNVYDLSDKWFGAKLADISQPSYDTAGGIEGSDGSGNDVGWFESGGTIYAYYDVGGQSIVYQQTYDPTTFAYLRIREADGITYWEASTNGASWTSYFARSDVVDMTDLTVRLHALTVSGAVGTSTFTFDDFYLGTSDTTVNYSPASDVVLQGGNSLGSNLIVGTIDSHDLSLIAGGGQVALFDGVSGAALFHNSSDSTNAFEVQNSAGTDIFNIDTANSRITIGNPTADATASLLVLDTKNTSGDPSGINGSIYYNSFSGKFRCYEGNAWKDCIATGGGGTGVSSVGTINGGTLNGDAASINSTTLYLQTASGTNPGVVSTGTQGFAGDKTFSGHVNVNAASDSTSIFQVQNASNVSLFTVDSTNSRLYVGNTSADAVGALLVLDTKNTSSDPTGVDGAMYYNSATQQMRCYFGGYWDSCGTNPIDHAFNFEDEFLGGGTASGTIGNLNWGTSGTCTNPTYNSQNAGLMGHDHPGVLDEKSGGTSGNICILQTATAKTTVVSDGDTIKTTGSVTGTLNNVIYRVGWTNQGTTAGTRPTSGAWWEADNTTNTHWQYCYGDGGAAHCNNASNATPSIAANSWVSLEIHIVSSTAIDFIYNGTVVSVTGITLDAGGTNKLTPTIACGARTGAAQTCEVDYFQWKGTTTSRR